jgi:hypothetical protein
MPEFIYIFFCFYSGETISTHESRDDYVTIDNIEFNQKTLWFSTYAHNRANEIQIKQGRLWCTFSIIKNYATKRDSCPEIVLHQNFKKRFYMNSGIVIDIGKRMSAFNSQEKTQISKFWILIPEIGSALLKPHYFFSPKTNWRFFIFRDSNIFFTALYRILKIIRPSDGLHQVIFIWFSKNTKIYSM